MDFSKTGIHRYESGFPARWVVTGTPKGWMQCEACGREFRVWVTEDSTWRMLPRRLWARLLCTSCFRRIVLLKEKLL